VNGSRRDEAGARRAALAWTAVALLAALLARAPGLGNDFVNYDDPQVNAEVASKSAWDLATGVAWYGYQPVYLLSLKLDRWLFGEGPFGPHFGNWALFGLCAGLAAALFGSVARSAFVGGVAALLLAVHPVHTENVAWASERKDVLSLALVLLAHLAYRRARARAPGRVPVAALVLLALGGLAKPTVWSYAAVLAVDEALARPRAPGALRRLLPVALVAAGGVVLHAVVAIRHGPGAVLHDATTLELAAASAGAQGRSFLHLVWPAGLSVHYAVDPRGSWADLATLVGVLVALLAAAAVAFGIARRRPVVAVAGALWLAGLAPVNNLWPRTAVLQADRYLLVPALGVYLVAGLLLARVRAPAFRLGALAAVAAGLGLLAASRATVFADSVTLWTDALEKEPHGALAWTNRGVALQDAGDWEGVARDASRAVEEAAAARRPEQGVRARQLLSLAHLALAQRESDPARRSAGLARALAEADAAVLATRSLEKTPWVREDPRQALARSLVARGDALQALGELEPAAQAYREAVSARPDDADAQWKLGNLLAATAADARIGTDVDPQAHADRLRALAEAAIALRRAHDLRPGRPEVAATLVGVLFNLQRDDEANRTFEEAVRRIGPHPDLLLVRARLRRARGETKQAVAEAEDVARRHPGFLPARRFLAEAHEEEGREALEESRRTRSTAPLARAVEAFDRAAAVPGVGPDASVLAGDALVRLGRYGEARERYRRAIAAGGGAWIRRLEGRAAVLEAATLASAGSEDAAARALATAVRAGVPALDLGFLALEAEVARLLPAAESVLGGEPSALAAPVLVGAALLVGGDEDGARRALDRAIGTLGSAPEPGSADARVLASAHLLRGLARARRTDLAGARADLDAAAAGREDDPLVAWHRLLLDRREASARLAVALGAKDEPAAARESATLRRVEEEASRLADRRPGFPEPALLAADLAIARGETATALRRLNALREEFPGDPSVLRGIASTYLRRSLEGGDRTSLLTQALALLAEARRLDERDPRVALDLSSAYRLAGRLTDAYVWAVRAAALEATPGEAARVVAALLVGRGRKALEGGDAKSALEDARRARAWDPASAAPDLLEGDVHRARRPADYDRALAAYQTARDKEPTNGEVARALAEAHRLRGLAYYPWLARFPRPKGADGGEPSPEALRAWEEAVEPRRRAATAEFEAALRLDPEGEHAESVREHVERLRGTDPEARRRDVLEAQERFREGERLRAEGRRADALDAYRRAAELFPDSVPPQMRIAEIGVELGEPAEREALRALDVVRDLDVDRRYPEADLLRARVHYARWRRGGPEEEAATARRGAERFLAAAGARGDADGNVAAAKRILAGLDEPRPPAPEDPGDPDGGR
jgi:tetratricopeptide (TPR) repeat protein